MEFLAKNNDEWNLTAFLKIWVLQIGAEK